MKWTVILASVLLLGGCVSRSIPNLEDAPTAQASTAPGTVADTGPAKPNLEDVPPTAQASTAPGTITGSVVEPPAEQQSAATSTDTNEPLYSGRPVKLTAEERSAIERGVQKGLAGPTPVHLGPMAATVSKVTSKSYIVCGWVEGGDSAAGYKPFLAMYVPHLKIALLVAVAGRQPENLVRQRCVAEGVPLPS